METIASGLSERAREQVGHIDYRRIGGQIPTIELQALNGMMPRMSRHWRSDESPPFLTIAVFAEGCLRGDAHEWSVQDRR